MDIKQYKYFIMTLDPVHVGTGGYRLGRVDNAIVREPGTYLPKIPGTSLHGAIRSAAAVCYGDPESRGPRPKGTPETSCIAYTFGAGAGPRSASSAEASPGDTGSDEGKGSFSSGVVSIYDARILFFPVISHSGPAWITTAGLLREAGFRGEVALSSQEEGLIHGKELRLLGDNGFVLGWLMLTASKSGTKLEDPTGIDKQECNVMDEVLSRTVIVHDNLFSELVNSGLEVRTSVGIDPKTGAAEEGVLFTYEALPRATILMFDMVVDDYMSGNYPPLREEASHLSNIPEEIVQVGLNLLEFTGVGGMTTRGFGRIRRLARIGPQLPYESRRERL